MAFVALHTDADPRVPQVPSRTVFQVGAGRHQDWNKILGDVAVSAQVTALEPGDAFEVNGRFACVVHAAKTAVIRVTDDEVPYTVSRALAETLVRSFRTDPKVVEVKG